MTTQNLPDYGWTESKATGTTMRVAPFLDSSLSRFAGGEPLRIIDLGCGNGRLISLLQGFERTWVGIDPALSGIEMARNLVPDAKFVQTSISEHLLDELDEPPFDVAVSLEVVEHMYDAWDWGWSAFRLLKPGGLLVASTRPRTA